MDGSSVDLINNLLTKLQACKLLDKRCELGEQLLSEIRNFTGSLNASTSLSRNKLLTVVEGMLDSMSVKLIALGLDVLLLLDQHMHESKALLRLYHAGLSKLGDSKAQIREFAKKTMKEIGTSNIMREKTALDIPLIMLKFANTNRNWQIRQLILEIMRDICSDSEAKNYVTSTNFINLLPLVVDFLLDANSQVREESSSFLNDVSYYHFKLIVKHVKAAKITLQRLKTLLPSVYKELNSEVVLSSNLTGKTSSESSKTTVNAVVTEEDLMSIWDIHIRFTGSTLRDATLEINSINEVLKTQNEEWDLKMEKLQKLRGLVVKLSGTNSLETISIMLKEVEFALSTVIKDMRSHLCKEACATISFLSFKVGDKFCNIFENLIRTMIPIFQSSIRVISSSVFSCVSLCLKYTVAPRVIPIIIQYYENNRSKEIRRKCMELLNIIFEAWSESSWKNYVIQLSKMIHSGLIDADNETRTVARSIFWFIAEVMKPMADSIFNRLDNQRKKLILQTKPEGFKGSILGENQRIPSPGFCMRSISNVYRLNTTTSVITTPVHVDNDGESQRRSVTIDTNVPLKSLLSETDNTFPSENKDRINSTVNTTNDSSVITTKLKSTSFLIKPTKIDIDQRFQSPISSLTKSINGDVENSSSHKTLDNVDSSAINVLPKPSLNIGGQEAISTDVLDDNFTELYGASEKVYYNDDSFLHTSISPPGEPGSTPYIRKYSVNIDKNLKKEIMKNVTAKNDLLTPLGKALASLSVGGEDEVHESLKKLRNELFERNNLTLLQSIEIKKALLGYLDNYVADAIKITCVEALIYFIAQHGSEQGDYMPDLIPLIFDNHSKSKNEVLSKKIIMLLETVRDSVPSNKQLAAILKYLSKNPDLEASTKSLILQMINVLLMICDDSDFYKTKEFPQTVTVLINWAMDLRNTALRKESSQMILAISQLCPPQFHKVITVMSLNQQNYVATIIRKNFKLEKFDSSESSPIIKNQVFGNSRSSKHGRESEDSF